MDAKTVNSLYERFKIEPDLGTEPLYNALIEFAHKIGRVYFADSYLLDEFRDVCHDAGTDVFMDIGTFRGVNSKGKPCRFASFAQNTILHDLMNWKAKQDARDVVTLDDPANPVLVYDEALPLDTKMYYAQLLDRLSPEERDLFALFAEGYTQAEIAQSKGVNQSTVSRQWEAVQAKLREWNDEKPPACVAQAKHI